MNSPLGETAIETSVSPEPEALPSQALVHVATSSVCANADLIDIILSFLDPAFHKNIWDVHSRTRKILANIALTSSTFYYPAMRYLWRMMESLTPLFKILPNFSRTNDRSPFTISGSIEPKAIARLRTYAANIWYLRLKSGKDAISSHTIFRLLSLGKTDPPILPALKMVLASMPTGFLITQDSDYQNLNCLFLAMNSPMLSTLSIADITHSSEDFSNSLLESLSVNCDEVKRIILRGQLSHKTLDVLPRFHQIRTIHLTGSANTLPISFFLQLGTDLNHLKSVIFSLDDTLVDASEIAPVEEGTTFNALEYLELNGSAAEIAKVLKIIKPLAETSPLHTIKLSFPSYWSNGLAETEGIATGLRECGRMAPLSLRYLQLVGGRGVSLAQGSLIPLSACTRLESLTIRDITLALSDDDIQEICRRKNWTTLRVLRLPASPDGLAPSLLGIRLLTEGCSQLHTLSMSIDFRLRDYEALQEAISEPQTANQLQTLSILEVAAVERAVTVPSSTMLAIGVSRFLEHHYRRLEIIEYPGSRGSEWWTGVRTMMLQFRIIRGETTSKPPAVVSD